MKTNKTPDQSGCTPQKAKDEFPSLFAEAFVAVTEAAESLWPESI